jgi:hypothetical protein
MFLLLVCLLWEFPNKALFLLCDLMLSFVRDEQERSA